MPHGKERRVRADSGYRGLAKNERRIALPLGFTKLLVAGALVPVALVGQEVVRIPPAPACPECRIELEHVMTFGSVDDSVTVGAILRRDARGEYFTRSRWAPHQVVVFGATGELSKIRGRRGEGPGDYQFVDFLATGRGDTLHVFDTVLRRETLLAPGSLTVGRIVPLPLIPVVDESQVLGPQAYVLFPDGRYVVNAEKGDSALHLVGVDGALVRSFGVGYREEDLPPPPSNRVLSVLEPGEAATLRRKDVIHRQLAAAGEGRIWAAYPNRYEIELWDTAGHRLRRLAREPEWFAPWRWDETAARRRRHNERGRGAPGATPLPRPPFFVGLEQDERGRIWTFFLVEGESSGTGPPREKGAGDTRIEVLDPRDGGRLIASARFPWELEGVVAPGLVAVREIRMADGLEIVKVFRVVLVEG